MLCLIEGFLQLCIDSRILRLGDTVLHNQQGKRAAVSYAWVVLFVLFLGQAAPFGMRASFGAYISPWERDFSASRGLVTSISMLSFVVFAFAQPLVGKLNDHFGKSFVPSTGIYLVGISLLLTSQANHMWQIFVFFGVVFSLGVAGCCNVIAAAIISNWFIEKKGFALGLATSGMAVGQLIMVPVNLFIIERLDWRATMVVMGIIIMIIIGPLFIIFLRSKPEEKGLKPYGYTESGDVSQNSDSNKEAININSYLPLLGVLKLRAFWLLTIPYFICGFTDVGLIQTHLIPMAEGKGFPVSGVAIAFSLIAIANIAGAIITGHLSDHFNRKRQLAIIYLIRIVTFVFLAAIRHPWLLLPFGVVYGAVEMASIAPTNSLTVQLFDKYSIGAVLGLVSVSHQVGGAIGSWAPGFLFDLTGSYSAVLAFSIALLLGASFLVLRIPEPDNNKMKQKNVF